MDVGNQPTPPLGASSEGVGRGQRARVLFNLADQPRKIIITKLNNVCYFLPPIQLTTPPKWWYHATPMHPAHHISPPCYPPLWPPVFGWLLCFGLPIDGRFTQPCILFSLCLHCPIRHPKQWDSVSPHAPPPCTTSTDSLPLLMPTIGWLLCFPFKFWPLKAKATPIALSLMGYVSAF